MWIFTTSGFVSAVKNNDDRTIIVRSRDRESLEQISAKCHSPIKKTPFADYPYRVFIRHEDFISWIANEASALNYRNFKSEVAVTRGKDFSRTLGEVWSTMCKVEDSSARGNS
jgi:hypothetical protein